MRIHEQYQQALGFGRPIAADESRRPPWHIRLQGSDTTWAIAFLIPYVAIFVAFVAYPVVFGLWMGSSPALYGLLFGRSTLPDHRDQHAAVRRASA